MAEQLVGTVEELGPGSVRGVGSWAVVNVDGARDTRAPRRCRHLGEPISRRARSTIRVAAVCPWHQARYDVTAGRMTVGPQAGFEKVPGSTPRSSS